MNFISRSARYETTNTARRQPWRSLFLCALCLNLTGQWISRKDSKAFIAATKE